MRRKSTWLLCSALALELALSGIGTGTGHPFPALTVYAEESAEQDADTEGATDASAEEDPAVPAGDAAQEAGTEAIENASTEGTEETVSGTPAAADSTEEGQDEEVPSGDEEENSGTGQSTGQEEENKEGNQEDASDDSGKDDTSEESGKDDTSKDEDKDDPKVSSFTVENWRNCSELKGAVKSVKLNGKDFTAAEAPSTKNSKDSSKDASKTDSDKEKEKASAKPMTFKAGQKIPVEIELNKGFVFDNTFGHGWSVWWAHRDGKGEYLVVSGSLEAAATKQNPLLLKGTIELPPEDKTKYEYQTPEEVNFDTLTLMFDALKIIDSVDVTVAAPVCGTKLTVADDSLEQSDPPVVTVPRTAFYKAPEDFNAWVDYENYKKEDGYLLPMEGTIKGDTTCYAMVTLIPSENYGFPTEKELTETLQAQDPDMKVFFSSPLMATLIVPVTARHGETEDVVTKDTKATCTEAGVKKTETRCKACGTVLDSEEVKTDATGHDWGEWKTTKEPTATQAGERTRTCKNDASHVETQEIAATGEPEAAVTYTFTKGANSTWTKSTTNTANLAFTVNRSADNDKTYGLFEGIEIDGKTVNSSNYTAASGSLNLTLKNAYLKTLTNATHTLKINFQDGSVSTKFTVKAAAASATTTKKTTTTKSNSPKTGDESHPVLWISLAAGALAAIVILTAVRRKKKG